jgi:hypothetical protein
MVTVKWPVESVITAERKAQKINTGRFNLAVRQQMPQLMAVALLGGFRGVVCDFVWINAHGAWERQEWFKMKQYFITVTTLQPMSVLYWETSAWHMAWNISYSVSQNPYESRAAKRELARRQWIEEGKRFLEKGIENVPERYNLYFHLGWLIMQKMDYIDSAPEGGFAGKHYLDAAEWFKTAWTKFPTEAPTYVSRMAGHCYMKAAEAATAEPDREKKYWQMARDWWCTLIQDDPARSKHPDQMWYKIEQWKRDCEERLGLPADSPCPPAQS